MFRRLAAGCVFALSAAAAAADPGPTLLTVFPPGAKAGETVEVTFAGAGFDGGEALLFSDPKVTAEPASAAVAIDPKAKGKGGGKMAAAGPSAAVKFKVTVPKNAPYAVLDVRVVSKSGLSNPRAFAVGTLPEVNEKEPNNDVGEAQKVELDTTVNGAVASPTDVDYFTVKAKAGRNVVVSCLSTSLDSKLQADLTVIGPNGKIVAANRGYRDGDAVIDFLPPADGDYLVRVAQVAYTTGGPDHFYRLTVTTGPWVDAAHPPVDNAGDPRLKLYGRNLPVIKSDPSFSTSNGRPLESMPIDPDVTPKSRTRGARRTDQSLAPSAGSLDAVDLTLPAGCRSPNRPLLLTRAGTVVLDDEKNDTAATAQVVAPPCDIAGHIEKKNDRDWYAFAAKKGEVWTLEVFADRLGSPVDAYFVLTNEAGKVIVEADDSPDTLSPNQFFTKSDDPARTRFAAPADGTYKVMVSTREASIQAGARDQYVLRIAKEKPDFRLAVMPVGTHYPDAGTLPKGGAALFAVYVWRFDGFDGPISLRAANLPPGVACPPQVIGRGQTRGTLVLTAAPTAADWAGFVTIQGETPGDATLGTAARPFSVVWPFPGVTPAQPPPNAPVITRMDRGPGLAVAVRGAAPFALAATAAGPLKVKAGEKAEFTVKVTRAAGFKDAVQVYAATPAVGPKPQGNNPPLPLASIAADQADAKVSLDIPATWATGTYTIVLRGQPGAAPPKGGNQAKLLPSYPTPPFTIEVEGKAAVPKKK